jgi:hypothetical protein
MVSTRWAQGYRELQLPPQSGTIFSSGMPFDHARNAACQHALEKGFTWLFFLDDDVVPPPDVLPKLISKGRDIIGGLYYRRAEPIVPVMLVDTKPKPSFITQFQVGSLVEVDLIGAGCMLVHRRVLEAMPPPRFEWLIDYDGVLNKKFIPEEDRCSEDFAFCRRAKKLGFSVCVDTSVQCSHIGISRSDFGGVYAPASI